MAEIFSAEAVAGLKYETPYFLFSERKIISAIAEFNGCFPGARIHYAMKANSEPEILRAVFAAGAGFEVASAQELALLKELGVPPSKIIFGSSVKAASHIKAFRDYGVDCFAFDSLPELEKIAANAPGTRVYVRVHVDDASSVFRFSEKFGADKEEAVPLLRHAQKLGLRPVGISFHVGSQGRDACAWAAGMDSLRPYLTELAAAAIDIEFLNLGGGFPCTYASGHGASLHEIARHTHAALARLPYRPALILEPGRGVVADAGILVSKVIARVERRGRTWLFLDAGVYNALYEALAFQGSTRYRVEPVRPASGVPEIPYSLAGPTGDGPDVIMRDLSLPHDMAAGDKLIFHAAGAYSLAVASSFNGFPKPPVYFLNVNCAAAPTYDPAYASTSCT
jgi:ornithine decarboxylase